MSSCIQKILFRILLCLDFSILLCLDLKILLCLDFKSFFAWISSYSFRGNYSSAETIQGRKLLIIKRFWLRKLFKGGNYSRKYGIQICVFLSLGFWAGCHKSSHCSSIFNFVHVQKSVLLQILIVIFSKARIVKTYYF